MGPLFSQHFLLLGSCQWDVKEPTPTIPGMGVLSVRIDLNIGITS